MSRPRSRGSVLALSLVMMLLTFSLVGSLLAVAAARCRAIARESRRAQALALAESAVSVAQARLAAGQPLSPVTRTERGRVVVKAMGTPLALVGGTGTVTIQATLARQGGRWRISAWQEVE
jgi:Tfp pilus assembly protein PilX